MALVFDPREVMQDTSFLTEALTQTSQVFLVVLPTAVAENPLGRSLSEKEVGKEG